MNPQVMDALNRANEVRLAIAGQKREIAQLPKYEGMRLVAQILRDNPSPVNRVEFRQLLVSIRFVGAAYAAAFLRKRNIGHCRRVCELTARQRDELATELEQLANRDAYGHLLA